MSEGKKPRKELHWCDVCEDWHFVCSECGTVTLESEKKCTDCGAMFSNPEEKYP